MSGIEVAGLILGALPLAIQAIRSYRSILSSLTNVARDLDSMTRDLATEQQILQNTCEILLQGIVPGSKIDAMIDNPFGPDWNAFDHRIKLRLWRSGGQFQAQVLEMQAAVGELHEKLAVQADGMTILQDRRSILAELKRSTSFTLKKKDYESIMSRIRDGNLVLTKLAQQNSTLEPARKSRSQAKITQLIRKLSSGVFNAVQNAITCGCIPKHGLGIELVHREDVIVPGDLEDEVAEKLDFQIVFGSHRQADEYWERLCLQPSKPKSTTKDSSPLREALDEPNTRPSGKARRVRFFGLDLGAKSASATQIIAETSINLSSLAATIPVEAQPLRDLCRHFARSTTKSSACGFVADAQGTLFQLHRSSPKPPSPLVTLRHVLASSGFALPAFGYPERLKLALALSTSFLHLYGTPWLSSIVTLDDVVFLQGNITWSLDQPFIAQALVTDSGSSPVQPGKTRPLNLALLSLGTLLIQIIIGRSIEGINMDGDASINTVFDKQAVAKGLTGTVLQNGGMNYDAAVQWCLDSVMRVSGFEHESFCQSFYEAVIAKLEADVELIFEQSLV